jgi:diguanylate cyclase (GGDEF)-like protein
MWPSMTLHGKAVMVILVATVAVAIVSFIVAWAVLIPGLRNYERRSMEERLETLEASLRHALADVDRTAIDYSTWDRTYSFMVQRNGDFERTAFNSLVFENYHIQLVMLISLGEEVVLQHTFAAPDDRRVEAADLAAIHESASQFMTTIRDEVAVQGVVTSSTATYLVVVRPVLNTSGTGPPRGMLVMARRLDDRQLALMAEFVHAPVGSLRLAEADGAAAPLQLRSGSKAWLSTSGSEATGNVVVRDLGGAPAAVLTLRTNRDLYLRGRRLIWLASALVAGVAILLGLGKLWFLHSLVLSRLDKASAMVGLITNQGDLSIRIPVTRDDELGVLARAVNTMLDQLERSRNKLVEMHAASEYDALHDALTGLKNRRAIHMVMELEMGRAVREKKPLGVLLADIDHFKNINDAYGHGVGDTVLCSVAKALDSGLRPYDAAGRYGGEEFLILVPGVNHVRAMAVADRLRRAVEQSVKVADTPVTVSIGVTVTIGDDTPEAVIEAADKSLYAAKAAGRNCVEMVAPEKREVSRLIKEYSGA